MAGIFLLAVNLFMHVQVLQASGLPAEIKDDSVAYYMSHYRYKDLIRYLQSVHAKDFGKFGCAKKMYYHTRLSYAFFGEGLFVEGMTSADKAIKLYTKCPKEKLLYADALLAYSFSSNATGNFNKSLGLVQIALPIAEKFNDSLLLRHAYFQLGAVNIQNSRIKESLQYFKHAYRYSKNKTLQQYLHQDELNIGLCYLMSANMDSSLVYIQSSIQHSREVNDKSLEIAGYLTLANWYQGSNDVVRRRETMNKALALSIEHGHKVVNAGVIGQMLGLTLEDKDYDEVIRLGKQALEFQGKDFLPLANAYTDSILFVAYKAKGMYDKALEHFTSFHAIKNNILNQKQLSELNKIEQEFKFREEQLELENKKLELENSSKQLQLYITLNFLFGAILLAFLIYRWVVKRYRSRLYQKEKMMDYMIDLERSKSRDSALSKRISAVVVHDDEHLETHKSVEVINEDKRELYDELIRQIEEKKLYLNPNLDLKLMITLLGTNKFYLYKAISNHAATNFRNIINRYRVSEAKKLICQACDEGNHDQISGIYPQAGFNSTTSYYRIFKDQTGLTPMEYAKEYLKEKERTEG